jgi:hypothetical protein
MKKTKLLLLSILLSFSVIAQEYTIGFYNVENLFDTINTPGVNDYDFTPEGYKKWTSEKYFIKLKNLAEVIFFMGSDPKGPAILGVCEVENRQVLEDLLAYTKLKQRGYKIIHYDSPDKRGIDVALFYKPELFTPLKEVNIPVIDPADPGFNTRNQLLVTGLFDGDTLSFIVNHWPSRVGGATSMAKRALAAEAVRAKIDSMFAENPARKVIIMGDLNDDPTDKSVTKHLGATGKRKDVGVKNDLYNATMAPFKENMGTLVFRGRANLFDQMIISGALLQDNALATGKYFYKEGSATPYILEFMVVQEGQWKGYPYRTYSGNDFQPGYSDHWPVIMKIEKKK